MIVVILWVQKPLACSVFKGSTELENALSKGTSPSQASLFNAFLAHLTNLNAVRQFRAVEQMEK